ncbi:MAG: hypothetical protein ACRCTJ_01520 [Brevinema sp.]
MKIASQIFIFFFLFFISPVIYGDDIWFLMPSNNQPVTGMVTIKIHPPYHQVPVNVWIEHDHTDQMVWRGILSPDNNYSIIVNTDRFRPGKYEINAEYYADGDDYDGDINIWVNPS